MSAWTSIVRPDPDASRTALYQGALLRLPPSGASRALVEMADALLHEEVGADPRRAWERLPPDELFARLGRVRKALYLDEAAHRLIAALLADHGLDPADFACDPARLRVVHPYGERQPAAAAVYGVHRDIWYGHPSCLVTWWIPLHDVVEEETFELWPEYLTRPVDNDSHVFDYDAWVARGWSLKIGWQDPEAGLRARYPAFLGQRAALGRGVPLAAMRAESLLFSGAHLHATRPHTQPQTRFSLDLRIAHLGDAATGRGAPIVDNESRGSSLPDYVRLGSIGSPAP